MILIGIGAGLGFPSLMTLAMSGATPSDSGLASGVGQYQRPGRRRDRPRGATFATERTEAELANGESAASALNSGYHLAYLIGAGLVLVAIAVALSALRSQPEAATEPSIEALAEPADGPGIRIIPLPADAIPGGGCVETGMRVTLGCGGCAGCSP
jgi:hypothetical protein